MVFNVPGRPVICNCETSTEKASEFLDSHLKTIMQKIWSYIKDSADFINKIGQIGDIRENAILVTADVVGKRKQKYIPTGKLINMGEFVLKNNFLNLMVLLNNRF